MLFTLKSAVLLAHIYTCTYMCACAAQPSSTDTSTLTSRTTQKQTVTTTTEKPTTTVAPCVPSQPNNTEVVPISTSSLNVSWKAIFFCNGESITYYSVTLSDRQNSIAKSQSKNATGTSIQFSELRSGNPYEASVTACTNRRCGMARPAYQYTYPETPIIVAVDPVSTSQLAVKLLQNGSAVGYNILVNGSNATFIPPACSQQALCTGNVNLTIEKLSVAGGCYVINVKAKAGEQESNSSQAITGCTLPPDPGDLSCIAKDNSSLVVLINPPFQLSPPNYIIQSYILEYWEENSIFNFTGGKNVTGTENTTTLNPLNSGYSYRIKVTSFSNGFKSSGASNISCTTNLSEPTIQSVEAMESSIVVKWTTPPSPSNFDIITGKCLTSVGKNSNFNSSKADSVNFCSDVTPGVLYDVTVATALNDASLAEPAYSKIYQVVAIPSPPNNVTAKSTTESSITIVISYPSSAILCTEYRISAMPVLNSSPEQSTKTLCNSSDITHVILGLQSDTQYNISVFAIKSYTQTLIGESQPTYISVWTIKKPGGQGQGWIAGVVIGVVAFVVILVILSYLVYRQRLVQKNSSSPVESLETEYENVITEVQERPPTIIERPDPVSLEDFDEKVELLHKDSDFLFIAEFETLASMSADHPMTVSELQVNRVKNRYYNTSPYDHARVVLSKNDDDDTEEGSDYINASFVPGYNSRREFIAAQGPMKSTVDDFWRMIWEQNVHIIVMVTNLIENKKEKCYQYWPSDQESVFYGDIQVNLISEETFSCYVLRHLEVRKGNKGRKISQYHHTEFLDFGTPDNADEFVEFVQEIQKAKQQLTHKNTLKPTIAHCSAGVGRTGTYILVDHLIHLIINKEENIDIFGIILNMRDNRPSMVQNLKQYIFAHECVQIALERGLHKTAVPNGNANTKEKPLIDLDQNAIYMNTLGSKDTSETSSEEHK